MSAEFVVYVLISDSQTEKIYIGFTSDLINRMQSHNLYATKGYTIRFRPWKVLHVDFFKTKSEAMAHEKFLKSGVGRKFIKETLML